MRTTTDFMEEMKMLELESFKRRVIKDATWVREQWHLGENYFVHQIVSLRDAERLAKNYGFNEKELKEFVRNEYYI